MPPEPFTDVTGGPGFAPASPDLTSGASSWTLSAPFSRFPLDLHFTPLTSNISKNPALLSDASDSSTVPPLHLHPG